MRKRRCKFRKNILIEVLKDVYSDIKMYYPAHEIEKAESNPKHKMVRIFRWYFGHSSRLALKGSDEIKS